MPYQENFMKNEYLNLLSNFGLNEFGNYVEKSRKILNLILVFL